jgi:hypothetical protein
MDSGADTIVEEESSAGNGHMRHIFLRKLVGIGMKPTLKAVAPCGSTEEVYLVANKIEEDEGDNG